LPTTSNNAISGSWSPAINNQSTTTYTFTPTAGQCAAPTTMTVEVTPIPAGPTVSSPVNKCFGDPSTTLTATGSGLLWYSNASGGTGSSTAPTASTGVAGNTTYYVSQTINGCESSPRTSIVVSVSQPIVDAGASLNVYPGSSTPVTAIYSGNNNGPLATVLWTPSSECNPDNQLSTVITPVATSGSVTYQITVTDNAGCSATDDLIVNVINQCINVRNAFSPNGDGINDNWVVYDNNSCLKNVTVTVFNRYGNKVYQNSNYSNNWLGTYDGKPIPDGTYYAVIDFTLINGKKITTRTDVTVVR
jgi:gliding motility-associated-like protein